jgi:phosphotransferase family enzyme
MRRRETRLDGVDTYLRRYPDSPILLDVLGTLDADAIRTQALKIEPEADEIFFLDASVGALFGVRRRDGSRVSIKVNKLFAAEEYLKDVHELQGRLAAGGYPAPRPLRLVGTASVDEWLDAGEFRNAHDPPVRRAMARELVRFHRVTTATGVRPRRAFLRPAGALWPKPHNVLFDFEATTAGAGWIDEIAAAARAVADAPVGAEVVGHTDWSAKHLRFDRELHLTALYDWDSVTVGREPELVGTAAGSFTYTEELEEAVDVWPSTAESEAFLAEYEEERAARFSADEHAVARAACVYLRAYAARCHHAYGGDARETGLAELAQALLVSDTW